MVVHHVDGTDVIGALQGLVDAVVVVDFGDVVGCDLESVLE